MNSGVWAKVKANYVLFAALCCVGFGNDVLADASWSAGSHVVYAADYYNADGKIDYLLRANKIPESVPGPYEVTFDVSHAPGVSHIALQQGAALPGGMPQFSINSIEEDKASLPVWAATGHVSLYGHFVQPDVVDLLLQAPNVNHASFVLSGSVQDGVPTLLNIINASALGLNISADVASITVNDINGDGLDDLSIVSNSVSYRAFAIGNGAFTLAKPTPASCPLVNGLKDTDCDGVADIYDAFPLDPDEQVDTDGDGIGNNADTDDDNDGVPDVSDTFPLDSLNGVAVGALSGDFTVSDAGKANYSVAIQAVPGAGSVTPSLQLNYSQDSGNGLLGVGWYLSGLSQIQRCANTYAQDGYVNGVNYDGGDGFCLNGHRLVQSAGLAGATGDIEYRTEQESYSRIVGHNGLGTGYDYFTVWRKDGTKEVYGGGTNSRYISNAAVTASAGKVHTFGLSRVEDRQGNYADYTYTNATNSFYIQKIEYGKNVSATSVPKRSIDFSYEARPDKFVRYSDNIQRLTDKRLKKISTSLDTQPVRSYELTYDNTGINNRSVIRYVKECYEVIKSCLPSSEFKWQQEAANNDEGKFTYQSALNENGQAAYVDQQQLLGDVNGDGIADLVWTYMNVDVLGWKIFYGTGSGAFSATPISGTFDTNLTLVSGNFQSMLGDVNGDGLADLVWAGTKNNTTSTGVNTISLLSDPSTTAVFVAQQLQTYSSRINLKNQFQLADINGDGRQDILYTYYWNGNVGVDTFLAYKNGSFINFKRTGNQTFNNFDPQYYQYNQFAVGDVNGDGKSDWVFTFVYNEKISRALFLAEPDGAGFKNVSIQRDSVYDYRQNFDLQVSLADVDGDGKSDFVYSYEKKNANQMCWRIFSADILGNSFGINNGVNNTVIDTAAQYELCANVGTVALHSNQQMQLVDINGDDRLDMVYSYREGDASSADFKWQSFLSGYNANGFVTFNNRQADAQSLNVSATTTGHHVSFADITGDGKADLVQTFNSGTDMRGQTFTQPISYPEHISQIINGSGETIKLTYGYLSATPGLYAKNLASAYPYRTDAGLSYVVSQVERSNGIGGWRSWDYTYKNARTHLLGRGFLGFAERTVKDNQRNLLTTYQYRLEYPYLGKLSTEIVTNTANSGSQVSATYNHWKSADITQANGKKTQSVFLDDTVSLRNDLATGNTISAVVTENTYNATYGTLINSIVSTGRVMSAGKIGGGFNVAGDFVSSDLTTLDGQVNTTNTYTNDNTANWRLDFLTGTTVVAGRNGAANKTYNHTYTPYNSTSFLVGTKTEFAGSNVQRATTYVYDGFGNVLSEAVTASDYSGGNVGPYTTAFGTYLDGLYPSSKTNAANHVEQYQYDRYIGKVNQVTDANGLITWMKFDGFGRELSRKTPDGVQTLKSYALVAGGGYKVTEIKPGSPDKSVTVDMLGRVTQETTKGFSGTLIPVNTVYDALGRKQSVSEPGGANATTYSYDMQDRVTSEIEPDGGSKTSVYTTDATYGSKVNVTAQIKLAGAPIKTITTQTQFNTYGQMAQTSDGLGISTSFLYDGQGYLRSTQVAGNAATTITVVTDVAGNKTQLNDPDAGSITYAYDGLGRARLETQPLGHTTLTGYDGLNRVVSKSYTGVGSPQNVSWIYDSAANGKGQLAIANAPNYQKTMTYDGLSRVKTESIKINNESTPKVFTYGYDQYSRLNQKTWPSGFAVKYGFNANGYAHTVKDAANDTAYWTATAMDVRGNVTGESFGNGVTTNKVFDITNGLAQSIQTGTAASPTAFQNLTYQWDTAGNLYKRTSAATGTGLGENYAEDFTYDNGHRLGTAITTGSITRNLAYGYDNLGNITSKTGVGTYTYGGKPHAVTQTTGAVNASYVYDAKGNMTQNGSRALTYSVFNLPLTINDSAAGTQTTFRYGPEEQLVWQYAVQNNVGTYTSYYGGDYEEVQQGDTVRAKTSVNGIVVYSTVKKAGSQSQSSDLSYLHTDHLGSTDSVTGRTAHLDTRMLFDPFGFRRQPSGADADATYLATLPKTTFETTAKGYTGHEQIDSVNLVHMGGRMYDPVLGRFLSPDNYVQFPEISQSYNRYSYVMNNPLSRVDPSGETETETGGKQPPGQTTGCGQTGACQAQKVNADIGANTASSGAVKGAGSDAGTQVSLGKQATSTGLDFVPVVGGIKSAIQVVTGRDIVTGETVDRRLEGAGIFLGAFPGGKLLTKGEKALEIGTEIARHSDEIADAAKGIGNTVKEGIYEFTDATGKKYCGQSCNIPNRLQQHVNSGKLDPSQSVTTTEVLGGKTAREIAEHKRIQEITGGVPARFSDKVSNKVDPIGPNREHLLNE